MGIEEDQAPFRAILFADIVDSSRLYQKIGDQAAQELIADGVDLLKDIVEQHNGQFVKSIGDEVMAEFDSAEEATASAVFMIQMIRSLEESDDPRWAHLHVKIGVHYGPVIEKNDDVFGNAVNIAARIVAQAKDSQILVTKAVTKELDEELFEWRFIDKTKLKGITNKVEIHEILIPQEEDSQNTTAILNDDIFAEFQQSQEEKVQELVLNYANNAIVVNYDYDRIKLGRNEDNEIVVNEEGVSRIHAQIEYKKGKYYLVDQSINGTFVLEDGGEKTHLRRDEMILSGEGKISLGSPPNDESPSTIHFKFES